MLALAGTGGAAAATGYLVVRTAGADDGSAAPPAEPTTPSHEHHSPSSSPSVTQPGPTPTDLPAARWSDPATWGGKVPTEVDEAVVDQPILLDVDARVAGVRIDPEGAVVFDPAASRTLTSDRNILVSGVIKAHPANPDVVHTIQFVEVDESGFEGGHTETPFDTDVGLWVISAGAIDLQGTRKTAWTNLTGAAEAGATTISVDVADGWRPGDEIVITPTEPTTAGEYSSTRAPWRKR